MASCQMARPTMKPDAPSWQAIAVSRWNTSNVSPADRSTQGTGAAAVSSRHRARSCPSSVSKRGSAGNSALRRSTPSAPRRRADSITTAVFSRANSALSFWTPGRMGYDIGSRRNAMSWRRQSSATRAHERLLLRRDRGVGVVEQQHLHADRAHRA